VTFPFICSNIPAAPAFGTYISQLIWYSITCGFDDRRLPLSRKILNQEFVLA